MNNFNKKLKSKIDSVVNLIKKQDITPLMPVISGIIEAKIDENFASIGRWNGSTMDINIFSGGSSRWVDRSRSTLVRYSKSKKGVSPTLKRSGVLYRQIEARPAGKNAVVISVNTPYAAIHQFGGIINHPGGTPYIFIGKGKIAFISKRKANELIQKGRKVRFTKPFKIKIPARPYITLTEDDLDEILGLILNTFNFLQ